MRSDLNLFKRTSEPIDVDGSSHEFLLHGDLQTASERFTQLIR